MRSPSLASSTVPSPSRALAVGATIAAALGGTAWSLATALRDTVDLLRSPGRASVDELVVAASAGGALLLLLWVTMGLLASVAAVVPGRLGAVSRRIRDGIAPEAVRRGAALLLGVAVVGGCAPGGAAASESRPTPVAAETASLAPAPLWAEADPGPTLTPRTLTPPTATPTQAASESSGASTSAPAPEWTPPPVRSLPPVTLTAARPAPESGREVTVRRGDTLWDLAAAHLPADATDAEVAVACRQWHSANRHVIGADPDLILPGQVLTVPEVGAPVLAGGLR